MEPILKNVIATCELQTEESIDLVEISSKTQGSQYNKRRFPGLVIRKAKPKGTILLFKSKKIMIVGCSSIPDT